MYNLILAFKRSLRTVYFPVLLVIFALVLYFSPTFGRSEGLPPAGVCCFDDGEASRRITDYLTSNGFIIYTDEDDMRRNISRGELDCGIVIPKGFGAQMSAGSIDGAVKFITSPVSYSPNLYLGHACAAIFGEYAPIITARIIADTGVTQDEVVQKYREMIDEGLSFSFEIVMTDSEVIDGDSRARTYTLGTTSLFIFAIMMYAACELLTRDILTLAPRIGMKHTLLRAVIPGMSVRLLGVITAALVSGAAAMVIRDDRLILTLLPSICIYTLLIAAFALLAAAVLADTAKMQIFTFFVLILALVLCPIYIDTALVIAWLEHFRILVMPYWLWLCEDKTSLLAAVLLCAAAIPSLYLRFSKKAER